MREVAEVFRKVYYSLFNAKNGTHYGANPSPRYDGGVDSCGRKHNPVWPRVAEKLVSKNIDIESYLEDTIGRYNIEKPQDTVKDKYIEEYLNRFRYSESDILQRWSTEEKELLKRVELNIRLGDEFNTAMKRVILDKGLSVSPLVRYCFARLNNFSHVIPHDLAWEAHEQYLASRWVYNRVCKERIPESWIVETYE